jgi:hypothetical protein
MSLSTQFTLRPPGTAQTTAVLDAGSATSPAVFTASQSGIYRDPGGALGISVNGVPRVLAHAGNVALLGDSINAANVLSATHSLTIGGERKVDGLPAVQPTWRNLGSYADPPTPALQLTMSNVTTYQNTVTNWGSTSQTNVTNRPTYVTKDPLDGTPAIQFDRTAVQSLQGTPVTMNCETNGGLTILLMFKFTGSPLSYEVPLWLTSSSGVTFDRINIERVVLSSRIRLTIQNGYNIIATGDIDVVQNTWNVIAYRHLNIVGQWTLERFLNGNKIGLGQTFSNIAITNRTLYNVLVGVGGAYFNGSIRYLGVWDRPLSDAELAKVTEAARVYPDIQGIAPISRFLQGSRDACMVEPASDMILPGPAGFPGTIGLAGAVLLPDGRIFCPPYNGTTARLVDTRTNTVSTPNLTVPSGASFQGSVLLPNGQIYLVPRVSTYGLTFDPATDTATTSAVTFDGTIMSGGVLLPSGQVFVSPYNATYALLYDYISDSLSTPSAVFPGNAAFFGATLMADGNVFCVPWNSTTARIFNPVTQTLSTPSGTYPGSTAFAGGVLLPDSRIFLVPYASTTARVYDAQTDTLSTPNGTYQTTGYRGGVLTACGRVAMIPYNAANAVLWDPQSDTLTTARGTIDAPDRSYWGGVLVPDGRIFMTPCNKTQSMYLYAGGWGLAQLPNNVLMSPWLNNKV